MLDIVREPPATLLARLHAIVGDRGMLTGPGDTAAYAQDWRGLYQGRTAAVLRPANTRELAAVVAACAEARVPVVPQGGNTSMVGGAVPSADGSELVVSLARMNRVRDIDAVDLTLTVEAGATLKAAQDAAAEAGCLLPLSIGSEGTAQVGGILATNAGGNNTVRYGNARDMVLGLEVVLPDGQIWNGLRRLRKDNTGYCLRQLFVGAEGTLGIITAAVLKLVPRPLETEVALCAVASPDAALALFSQFQTHDPAAVQAFEYMSGTGMGFVLKHIPGTTQPLAAAADHYVLVELATPRPKAGLRASSGRNTGGGTRVRPGAGCGDRRKCRPARRPVAASRGAFGGAEARGRQRQERRLGAGLQGAGADPPRLGGLRRRCCPASAWCRSATWATATSTSTWNSRRAWRRPISWPVTMRSWTRSAPWCANSAAVSRPSTASAS